MSIVRELLIKIGFVSDKKAINATNNAITGFKTRFAIVATAATYAASKVVSFFGDIATATLDAQDLASVLGTSLKEFTQLSESLKEFRLDDSQIKGALLKVRRLFVDLRTGANAELAKIARDKFVIDPNGGPLKVFRQILEMLGEIQDKGERGRIAESIFGPDIAERISDVSVNLDKLDESFKKFEKFGQSVEDSTPELKKYNDAVTGLTNSWKGLVMALSETVLPALKALIEYLTIASDFYKNLFTGNLTGLEETLKKGSKFLDPAFDFVGGAFTSAKDFVSDIFSKPFQSAIDYANNRIEDQPFSMTPALAGMGTANVTNNIDIQVPPGTSEEQARFMSNQVQQATEFAIWETFRQIQNNNPTVE